MTRPSSTPTSRARARPAKSSTRRPGSAAEEAVRTQLLLDALAEQQSVGVSQEEFTDRIMYNAERFGVSPDEYFKRLQEGNQLGAVIADVRRGKALANAVQLAKVTDASGNTLDVAALFGVEVVEDDDEEDGVIEGGVIEGSADADSCDGRRRHRRRGRSAGERGGARDCRGEVGHTRRADAMPVTASVVTPSANS